jgi:hypothetical protein
VGSSKVETNGFEELLLNWILDDKAEPMIEFGF